MPTKNIAVKVKATGADADSGLADGQFVALASVFNNVDAVGDVVLPGAFTDDLKAWSDSGDVIPLYWGHRMDDPALCVGQVLDAKETDAGLEVRAQLDLDTGNGAQVYRLIKGRRVSRMSFAYDIVDGGPSERDGADVYELRSLKLHEVSVVQVPANPAAAIQQVKAAAERRKTGRQHTKQAIDDPELVALISQADQAIDAAAAAVVAADEAMDAILAAAGLPDLPDGDTDTDDGETPAAGSTADAAKRRPAATKAGRVLSAKNEGVLRAALDKTTQAGAGIKAVLEAIDSNDDGKASPAQPAATEEPDGAKVDVPARPGPASLRLRTELDAFAVEFLPLTN